VTHFLFAQALVMHPLLSTAFLHVPEHSPNSLAPGHSANLVYVHPHLSKTHCSLNSYHITSLHATQTQLTRYLQTLSLKQLRLLFGYHGFLTIYVPNGPCAMILRPSHGH